MLKLGDGGVGGEGRERKGEERKGKERAKCSFYLVLFKFFPWRSFRKDLQIVSYWLFFAV